MPSRNITVPVSDWSLEAIDRTREPENRKVPVPLQYPQGRISLVNSGKKQDYLCPSPLWDILARHSNDHLSRGLGKCSFVELDQVRGCWSQNAKRKY
jgi:hypothetical protein